MSRARHLSVTPGTAIALVALFFALGGSAFAVGERIQSPSVAQQRCTNGAVRGHRGRHGRPEQGHGEHPGSVLERQRTSSRGSSTARERQFRRGESRSASTRCGSSVTPAPSVVANADRRRSPHPWSRSAQARSAFAFRTSAGPTRTTAPFIDRRRVATGSAARRTRRGLRRAGATRPRSRGRAT